MSGKLENRRWYRCRIQPGGYFDTVGQGTIVFTNPAIVLGGEAEGDVADLQVFVTTKTKDSVNEMFSNVFEIDSTKINLASLEGNESPIVGKEFWGQCDIQAKANGGTYPPRFGRAANINDRLPGGAAYKAATILGNTGTNPPSKEGFNERF